MQFLEPWMPAPNAKQLESELASEVGARHLLKGQKMQAVAVRQDCDDVLFVGIENPQLVAVVHLTYANRPESDPCWPATTLFSSIEEWARLSMAPDNEDFIS